MDIRNAHKNPPCEIWNKFSILPMFCNRYRDLVQNLFEIKLKVLENVQRGLHCRLAAAISYAFHLLIVVTDGVLVEREQDLKSRITERFHENKGMASADAEF